MKKLLLKILPVLFLFLVSCSQQSSYDIFGTAEFDTEVDGYLQVTEKEVFGEKMDIPYLVITRFDDEGFQESIESGVDEGNTVNKKENGSYYFNLGCLEDGKIKSFDYDGKNPYLDEATQAALLSSTADKPVRLKLSFGYHEGKGCVCCKLAHQIRILNK